MVNTIIEISVAFVILTENSENVQCFLFHVILSHQTFIGNDYAGVAAEEEEEEDRGLAWTLWTAGQAAVNTSPGHLHTQTNANRGVLLNSAAVAQDLIITMIRFCCRLHQAWT